MIKNYKKGFTLIELLVVIAIIGVLAAVVLAATNGARNKGADVAVKANLANTRAQAEIYYDTNGNYGVEATSDACSTSSGVVGATASTLFANSTILAQVQAAVTANSTTTEAICVSSDGVTGAGGNAGQWAISVPIKAGGNWCVDSTGVAKAGTATYNSTDFSAKCV